MTHKQFFRGLAIITSWPVLWNVWFQPELGDKGVAFTQYCAGASLGLYVVTLLSTIVSAWANTGAAK